MACGRVVRHRIAVSVREDWENINRSSMDWKPTEDLIQSWHFHRLPLSSRSTPCPLSPATCVNVVVAEVDDVLQHMALLTRPPHPLRKAIDSQLHR
jgi:hypothetical protein